MSTVRNRLCNILAKLHLKDRVQAAAYAVREDLVDPSGYTGEVIVHPN